MLQSDFYKIKTPPVNSVLRLIDVKNFLKVEHTADDLLIEDLILTCTDDAERATNRVFGLTTFTGKFSTLIESNEEKQKFVEIKKSPLNTIVSVQSVQNNILVPVDSSKYNLKGNDLYSRLLFNNTFQADENVPYPLEIEFTAGYTTLPKMLESVLKQHILFLYTNRGDVSPQSNNSIPENVKLTYNRYRIPVSF